VKEIHCYVVDFATSRGFVVYNQNVYINAERAEFNIGEALLGKTFDPRLGGLHVKHAV
jgi:hypothetical protein